MIKLKRLAVSKIDPSVGTKGQIEFRFEDFYLCENQIGGIGMLNTEPTITDNWAQKEIKKYCNDNNIKCCEIYTVSRMPSYDNIVVDDVVKELIEKL